MGMKENFTPAEWENLVSLPYAVSMTVMVAAPLSLDCGEKTKAIMQEPANLAPASGDGSCPGLTSPRRSHGLKT